MVTRSHIGRIPFHAGGAEALPRELPTALPASFAPVGPCVAKGLDPSWLLLPTFLNDTLMQEVPLGNVIFSIPFRVRHLSQCMTLFLGDIISAGTPRGATVMRSGDMVEVALDRIGVVRNNVRAVQGTTRMTPSSDARD